MALQKKMQAKIHKFFKEKILKKIEQYNLRDEDAAKPFQYALFTKKGYLAKGFIHGCETALGNWHESIAKIIAKENFEIAKKLQGTEKLKGRITNKAQATFENILNDLDNAKREPNHNKESEEIYNASQNDNNFVKRNQTVDLYLKRDNGEEIYFEIKGPKPNKNEMRAAKRDLLEIYAMQAAEGKRIKIFLGMYYNPYAPEKYQRWTCIKFFDKGNDFLVGKDFWDYLGGIGTFENLIRIYEKVGEEIRPALEKKFKKL
ncbi:MAG: TdeIII family type II restriction endonuclease [Gammaproteobacteria bacterium]|jgi:type II restriction enzyme